MASVKTSTGETYDWPPPQPMCKIRPTSKACPKRRAQSAISKTPRCSPSSAIWSQPTTSPPLAASRKRHLQEQYLTDHGVPPREFNSYGARRGNHEVMMRGTFANIRIKNEMLDDVEGGYTLGPDGTQASIFDAAMAYQDDWHTAGHLRGRAIRRRLKP